MTRDQNILAGRLIEAASGIVLWSGIAIRLGPIESAIAFALLAAIGLWIGHRVALAISR